MNSKTKRKYILILLMLSVGFILNGCLNEPKKTGELHTQTAMLDFIDNLNCGDVIKNEEDKITNDPLLSCKLKDKYVVVSEELSSNDLGKVKTVYLELIDYELKFSVTSKYSCVKGCTELDPVFTRVLAYTISTDYRHKAADYFIRKYNEENGIPSCLTKYEDLEFCYTYQINTKEEITTAAQYLNGYVEYLNNLDFRALAGWNNFSIEFPSKTYASGVVYNIGIDIALVDGKYVLETAGKNGVVITDLTEYLLNYCEQEEIFK